MRSFGILIQFTLLLVAVQVLASGLPAQTLESRSPAKPQSLSAQGRPLLIKPAVPQGTNFQVEITRHYPMKANETIEERLLHPIFVQGKLAIPEDTSLRGTVVDLRPDTKTRWHGRLHGDFTPFHVAQLESTQLLFPGGTVTISSTVATSGVPILHLTARAPHLGNPSSPPIALRLRASCMIALLTSQRLVLAIELCRCFTINCLIIPSAFMRLRCIHST